MGLKASKVHQHRTFTTHRNQRLLVCLAMEPSLLCVTRQLRPRAARAPAHVGLLQAVREAQPAGDLLLRRGVHGGTLAHEAQGLAQGAEGAGGEAYRGHHGPWRKVTAQQRKRGSTGWVGRGGAVTLLSAYRDASSSMLGLSVNASHNEIL